MDIVLEFLEFFRGFDTTNISFKHITIAAIITVVVYFFLFVVKKFIQKQDIHFSISDFLVKFGISFVVEFVLIWIYGKSMLFLSVVIGFLTASYLRNKFFSFIDQNNSAADHDLKMRSELAELKTKFKKNPYFSILEVLLYYGYISSIQKETVEAENIFKTPDETAKEFLSKPILTAEQLDEAIGIMNVIRREGKILTREEALLLIMSMRSNDSSEHPFIPDDEPHNTAVGD